MSTNHHLFDQLAPQWWSPTGPCKPLHTLNPIRSQFIQKHTPVSKQKLLDVGCGGGLLTEEMAQKGAEATGIDCSKELIEVAIHHASENHLSITYIQSTIEAYQATHHDLFDIITCMELLEHIEDPLSILQSCKKLLKPGGHLFLSTLNRTFQSYLLAILGAEYLLKIIPKNTHRYQQFIKPSELMRAFQETGFCLQDIRGIHYNPFNNTASFQQDLSINYIVHATSEV